MFKVPVSGCFIVGKRGTEKRGILKNKHNHIAEKQLWHTGVHFLSYMSVIFMKNTTEGFREDSQHSNMAPLNKIMTLQGPGSRPCN